MSRASKDALGLIKGALDAGEPRGVPARVVRIGQVALHGGAVAPARRQHQARAIQELAPLVADNRGWLGERKVLVVPMHLINAVSLESAVLGQYARHVRQRHPDCATPGFYRGDKLFADARNLRSSMGDISFFAKLSAASAGQTGWGSLGSGWDADAFEAAMDARRRAIQNGHVWWATLSTPSSPRQPGWRARTTRGTSRSTRGW
ncbi:MAG: hypothetical protein IPP20_11210 [Gemmatimonadetes bacterium]|nr:hypothetical protein [Gemmatimonadota bacterium]